MFVSHNGHEFAKEQQLLLMLLPLMLLMLLRLLMLMVELV